MLGVGGSVSVVSSTFLTWYILRSHDGLSTTYHRLVFGLSVADIMSSFFATLSSAMVPKEMNCLVPNAQGSTATCSAQGIIIVTGYTTAAAYNCCICLYYLAIIKFNKKDGYIKNKLELVSWNIYFISPYHLFTNVINQGVQ